MKQMKEIPGFFIGLIFVTSCAGSLVPDASNFIRVQGMQFIREGEPYHFVGTNLWYGCNLGSLAEGGDRGRLRRELDLLRSLGIDNLRVLGTSESGTQHNTIWPPLQAEPGQYDERLLDGLDFLLAEMAKREMVAVVYLNNYWVWSGGMSQYVSWFDSEPVPNPFLEEYSWDQFMKFSARFYAHAEANAAYRRYIEMLVNRKNRYTGVLYRDDPAIMAWQLGNEPRPGVGESGQQNFEVFTTWVGETADFIRSLDPNHLISTGNEGLPGCIGSAETYLDIHRFANIDYMTVHLWIFNWSWYDPMIPEKTYPEAERKALDYLDRHIAFAEELGKPLVLEEFGIPRDLHSYSPESATTYRDRFYATICAHIHSNAKGGGVFAGSNFWAWGGYGDASESEEAVWRRGDDFTGDPPQEPQGRNSVFATDTSTLSILEDYAGKMKAMGQR
jgi:mannan endo-1,4-beta-mannosidase